MREGIFGGVDLELPGLIPSFTITDGDLNAEWERVSFCSMFDEMMRPIWQDGLCSIQTAHSTLKSEYR
jgi:hypothetical protein